ncbi:MFS transporter [Hamadaea tsunoensis]|uniref:MFS transporter n=1 Tax=Hamadaea tsunoensis TaxID=53368 RepID=UPI000483FD45|nr:MFS transporter [Hamadaea tsunoensis]
MTATITASTPPTAEARLDRRARIALAVLLTASFTLAVDFSILNVALPGIGRDTGLAPAAWQWIATAYALCAAGFTLFFGRVSDLAGRRRLFLLGMALLGVASLAGGLAQEPVVLLAARIAQGTATAMVIPAALSLLTTIFPEGPARERALGLNGALMAAGFTTGALLGGLLTDLLSWRWAFFINVAVAVVVLAVAPSVLPENRAGHRPRLDVAGAVTVTLGQFALVYGATEAGQGWRTPRAAAGFAAAIVLFGLFWRIERRAAEPLIAPAVLRRRAVAGGNLAGLLAFATETALVFVLTLHLQEVLGWSPWATGLAFGVLGAGTVLGGLLAPRVIGRIGSRRGIIAGFAVQAAATFPLAFAGPGPVWAAALLALAFAGGVANLVAIVGYVVTATSGLPDREQGLATGLVTMSQQVGITLGTPILSAVVAGQSARGLAAGVHTAIWVDGLLCLAGVALAATVLRSRS